MIPIMRIHLKLPHAPMQSHGKVLDKANVIFVMMCLVIHASQTSLIILCELQPLMVIVLMQTISAVECGLPLCAAIRRDLTASAGVLCE